MRIDYFYSAFPHSSSLRNTDAVIAINNRFPNLLGYAVLNYIHEMMCEDKDTVLEWEPELVLKYAHQMGIGVDMLQEIVSFIVHIELLQFRKKQVFNVKKTFLADPYLEKTMQYFNQELTFEAAKEKIVNRTFEQKMINMSNEREYAHQVREMGKDLLLTEELAREINLAYPYFNDAHHLNSVFMKWFTIVTSPHNIKKNFKILNRDNYKDSLFMYLNRYAEVMDKAG